MAESPKRPADVSLAEPSRVVKQSPRLAGETARPSDSVPTSVGPFAKLPSQFGRYRIVKLLGSGAMGAVYLAEDTTLDRQVALKVAKISATGSARILKRMEAEAKAGAKIDHPQICKVYDSGEIDGIRFISLQYIEGEDLKQYLKRVGRQREPAEAVRLTVQLARALQAAHDKGVVHRDLKPENVMLTKQRGEPVIMDFGLARQTAPSSDAGLTQAGMVLGTAAYMSPEQASGKGNAVVDQQSDIYALGVILFEMLTGEWPFTGGAIEIMGKKCVQDPPSPLTLNPGLNPELAAVCHKMIAQKKEDRYASCAEVATALESIDFNAAGAPAVVFTAAQAPVATEPSFEFLEGIPATTPSIFETPTSRKSKPAYKQSPKVLTLLGCWWQDQPVPFRWTIVGAAAVCTLLLAITLFFRSGDALVKIEVLSDDIEVKFHNKSITFGEGEQSAKVTPGLYELHIKSGQIELDTSKFTLRKGENPVIMVELVNHEIVAKVGNEVILKKLVSKSTLGQSTAKGKGAMKTLFEAETLIEGSKADLRLTEKSGEYTSPSTGMKLALIPAGTFMMGSPSSEAERGPGEGPQHAVRISQPFYMGVYEVTQGEYESVMGTNPSAFSTTGTSSSKVSGMTTRRFPVETVSWDDAVEFCQKLSVKDGVTYRLPTEAEWEFAARAGTTTPFHFGSTLNGDKANVDGNHPYGTTTKGKYLNRPTTVGSYAKNAFGLFDIHGNVNEWCEDFYDGVAYKSRTGTTTDPKVTSGSERVLRGGSWSNNSFNSRSANRNWNPPYDRINLNGFRVVISSPAVKEDIVAGNEANVPEKSSSEKEARAQWVHPGGSFDLVRTGVWVEMLNGRQLFSFVEVERSADHILLYDSTRDCRVWLKSNRCTIQIKRGPAVDQYRGNWRE
jgi:formylglycine-generating enzyme required for sulfatase activity/serine/threonine protein kinase